MFLKYYGLFFTALVAPCMGWSTTTTSFIVNSQLRYVKSSIATSGPNVANKRSSLSMAKDGVDFDDLDGSSIRIGIIKSRWNTEIIDNLTTGVKTALKETGVEDDNIFETEVPGAFELPLAARYLALSNTVDAIICIGTLIKGDTMHFEYISDAAANGIMRVGLDTGIPVIFGVLTCLTEDQAVSRSTGDNNHGVGWGKTAVEMGLLRKAAIGKGTDKSKISFVKDDESGKSSDSTPKRKIMF